jgi:hypothetical protein
MRIASKKLPVDFQGSLPTVEEIETEFAGAGAFSGGRRMADVSLISLKKIAKKLANRLWAWTCWFFGAVTGRCAY